MGFRSLLFVRTSYKTTFLNRSVNAWRHLRLQILSPSPPSSALPATYFPCRSTAQTCQPHSHVRVWVANTRLHETVFWKILYVFRPLPGRVCVFIAAWLHIPDITFFAIHMGPSSVTFSTCVGVSAHSRLSFTPRDVTSSGHFALRYCNTFLLTLLHSLQHSLLLMLSLSLLWRSFSLYQKITPYIRFRVW
jgi:hypothetical protein